MMRAHNEVKLRYCHFWKHGRDTSISGRMVEALHEAQCVYSTSLQYFVTYNFIKS